jgi:aspartyl-tRNA(Asn)/glutamyl-tRNA(Gln) amidotransferase subunit A
LTQPPGPDGADATSWDAARIARAVTAGEVSAVQVVEAHLDRARARQPSVNGFTALLPETAIDEARLVDRAVSEARPPGPLAGVPVAVKDNICTAGAPTTCGSAILEGYRPPYDATAVERLRSAGAVILGKTSCDEFGMGSSNENCVYGPVRHPEDPERVPGGSSGGSAAVVADRQAATALGSDTGGSVRQPAAFCGIAGFKPTYGRVSRYGLVSYGSSLDQIGTLGRTVADAALVLEVMAGPDPRDATAADVPTGAIRTSLDQGISGLSVAVPRECLESEGLDPAVRSAVESALSVLAREGADVREASLPMTPYAIPAYYLVATAEASSNLARYDGVRYGFREEGEGLRGMYRRTRGRRFGREVVRRIMLGTYALSAGYYDAYYLRAQRARTRVRQDLEATLAAADVIVTPTAPTGAFRIGEKVDDPLAMYLSDIYTVPANLAGLPALSVPCGRSAEGLPVGLQVIGPPFGEALVARVGHAVERLVGA